jgi:mannose/fructose/N-acetylgalactosamine-specific phosphotransferase system component IIB
MNLIRVDDRLIHGQVSVGWAPVLRPDYLIIADDAIAADSAEAELYLLGVPFDYKGKVLPVKDTAEFLAGLKSAKAIVVLKDLSSALRLYESGCEYKILNIGGLHCQEGKKEITHYLFMNPDDIGIIKKISSLGAEISVQDLPGNKAYSLDYVIKKWEKNEG